MQHFKHTNEPIRVHVPRLVPPSSKHVCCCSAADGEDGDDDEMYGKDSVTTEPLSSYNFEVPLIGLTVWLNWSCVVVSLLTPCSSHVLFTPTSTVNAVTKRCCCHRFDQTTRRPSPKQEFAKHPPAAPPATATTRRRYRFLGHWGGFKNMIYRTSQMT